MSRKIFRGGGVDMNIHYRYSKIFKANFYEVVCAVLTLSSINITMLVKFFFVTGHCYRCLVAQQQFGEKPQLRIFLNFAKITYISCKTIFL